MDENVPGSATPASLLGSLRRIFETLLSTFQNRLELAALEMQEEKQWLVATLIWTALSMLFGFLAILLITFTAAYMAPEEARPYVLLGFCLLYVGGAIYAVVSLRKQLKERSAPFSETVAEVKKDLACMRSS